MAGVAADFVEEFTSHQDRRVVDIAPRRHGEMRGVKLQRFHQRRGNLDAVAVFDISVDGVATVRLGLGAIAPG